MWSVLVNHNGTFGEAPLKVIPQVHKPHPAGLRAVGMRLTFRQPPPIDCCSNQFLFFLNSRLAGAAYETWAQMSPESAGHLPPNRFHFEIHDMRAQ